ncbi:MAG TPA: hypothetical protein VFY28_01125 [Candidatus Paceibacterota bacterium]|nr:hypothetical protein [Candidatus Paceibacterota bacterium]
MEKFPTPNSGAGEMKPEAVRKAQFTGDREALSHLGKAGNKAAAEKRHIKKVEGDILDIARERDRARDEHARARQANEHIIPLDTYE